jgi:AraC-like DNA-binding protein
MTPDELRRPTVPIAYVLLTLQLAEERGIDRERMFKGMLLSPNILDQLDARVGLLEYGQLCIRALHLTQDPALGYEFGLRNSFTTHGFYGFGSMSQNNIREAIEFVVRFAPVRIPGWELRFFVDGSQAVIDARETVPYGILRQYALDMILVTLTSSFKPLLTFAQSSLELWFNCEEPAHYERYKDRLPTARFSMAANQIRFPAQYLDTPLATANAVTARLVARECERELALLGYDNNLLHRVRATLINEQGRYPDQELVAKKLYMTSRTLKRHLQKHGLSFQSLLDEARHRDSVRLLEDHSLSLEEIAYRLGYSASANFSRAFRKWSGKTPGDFRARRLKK